MKALEILRESIPAISVGMLTANLLSLGTEIELIEDAGVKLVHFDVMDGCFCPMTTVGPPIVKAVKTSMLKDVHLMIENPLDKLGDYASAGADIITVHLESDPRHIHRVLQSLGKMENVNDPGRGIVRGLAINPGTPVEAVLPLLDEVDMLTILAINPGWGGQKFCPSTRSRIEMVRRMIDKSARDILLCVDGGITKDNIAEVAAMGSDVIVTGSAVFDGRDPRGNAGYMLQALGR